MTFGSILLGLAVLVVALLADFILRKLAWNRAGKRAAEQAERLLMAARQEADNLLKEAKLSARERLAQLESAAAEKEQQRQEKLDVLERQLRQDSGELESQREALQARKTEIERQTASLARQQEILTNREAEIELRIEEAVHKLEEVAGLSRAEAQQRLLAEMTGQARAAAAKENNRILQEARTELEARMRDVVTQVLQRVSVGGSVESTVSVIRLPSDDMKGRIIGREGRNIRSIEMTTGIDLIVDDTPRTILISCFDPLRREIARISIERLVEDGRIHPARIEELVEKTREDLEQIIIENGEAAVYELGLQDMHAKLVHLLGRLKYHTAQGQNLLRHCRETAELAGMLAQELGLPDEVPRRAGLLHEVAQAEEGRLSLPSILASAEMAVRHGESKEVREAIAAAHPDVTARKLEGALVRFACRLSRSRQGARKHNLEVFISRMRRMESLVTSYPGVLAAYAFRAGRELRVLVESGKLSDQETINLSKELTARIKKEIEFTGEIRVSVLRETRAVDYAL